MKQSRRTQPLRTARSGGPNALSLTSPQSAPCAVPPVLERSSRNLADVKKCTGAVTGTGVLVKLYSIGDLWIVGSPRTKKWTPSKIDDIRTANATTKANDRTKASHPAKTRPSSAQEAKAQLNSDEAVTQKKLGSRARNGNEATEQQVHEDESESDDVNSEPEGEEDGGGSEDEEEEDEEEEEEDEEEEEEDDAGEGNDAREQDAGKDDAREENAGKKNVGEDGAAEGGAAEDGAAEDGAAEGGAAEDGAAEDGAAEDNAVEGDVGEDNDAEHGAAEDCSAEEDAGENDAGKYVVGDLDNSEEGQDLEEEPQGDAVLNQENGHDVGEQEGDGDNEASNETANEAASDMEDKGYEGEEDLAENTGIEGEREAEGRPEAEEQQEAARKGERKGEREGKEVTGEEMEPSGEARGKDCGVHGGEEEEHGGDWEAGTKQGDQDKCRGLEGSMGQRVTTNYRNGPWRSWKTGDTRGEGDEERCMNATGEEDTVEYGNGRVEEKRRRVSAEEHPNKRHKSGGDSNGVDTTTVHSLDRAIGLKAQPRLQTPPPKSTIPSTPSTIEIVRETSVVSGLEGTECAVWDAARRDSVVNSLPLEQQAKMVHMALCLGSKEGIDALRDFVQNAREESTRRRQALQFGAQTDTPHFGVDVWHATKTMNSRDSSLAQISDLYRKIDILDNKVVLSSIAKRVQLAAMAEYRKSLLQEGAGRNQAKDINLHLFHTVYPDHAMIRDPDAKGTSSAARRDWNRMCNRLREGRMWFEVRDLFGGVGAFLALPPQCVSDRHLLRLPATTFSSWLRLLEIAWGALDIHARRILNDLVRMSLAGQPLPDGLLALETLEDGPGTAPIILSDILTGWSFSEQNSQDDEGESTSMTHREKDGNRAAFDPPSTTAGTTNPSKKNDSALCAREMPDVDDGLLNDIEFDDGLSQEI